MVSDAKAWLENENGLSGLCLDDLSQDGRRQFIEVSGDQLFAFWSEMFELERGSLSEPLIQKAIPQECDDIGTCIAEKLLNRIATAEKFVRPPGKWADLESWLRWLVGKPAVEDARKQQPQSSATTKLPAKRTEPTVGEDLDKERFKQSCLELIDHWCAFWTSINKRTNRRELELYWLWATCKARRPLTFLMEDWAAEALEGIHDHLGLYLEGQKKALAKHVSADRKASDDSRTKASACLRFDIEYFSRSEVRIDLAAIYAVFIGPTKPKAPYIPTAKLGGREVEHCLEILEISAKRPRHRERPLEALETDVLRCAIMKAVDRMFPCASRPQIRQRIMQLQQIIEATN